MKWHLMRITVVIACHVVIPLCLALVGFFVLALLTGHLVLAIAGTLVACLVAWLAARRYTLAVIGPRFADRDLPVTWSFIVSRILKLLLLLLMTPAVVLTVYAATVSFTPCCVIAAILAGLPTQWFVGIVLNHDAQCWTWRVRRGRVIQSAAEIQGKIAAHARATSNEAADCMPWAGTMVPRELLAPHTKILGMTGSGKTITIRLMLQALVDRCSAASNTKLVVFDPKRELYSHLMGMDPQVPVFLFDATDCRGLAWDIAADITEPNHAKTTAKLLAPDEHTSQPYFSRSARRILEWVIRYLIIHASHWNLQDVFMILDDLALLKRILPAQIVAKYFKPETTLKNTLSTLDTLTSRFETVAACWANAEKEGRTISLNQFEASPNSAILVIPRRLDIADAIDPTIRLIFERLIHLWLARPDLRFLPPDIRPDTHVILDETAKAGNLARLDDLLLMGRAKGVSVTLAAQDVEAMRQEYGEKIADSLLAQCGNTAVFALESPETRDYCAALFGTCEIRERPCTFQATNMTAALSMEPKDLYHPGELREHKTLLSSQFSQLPRPADTGLLSGYFIAGGLGAHAGSYPFAHLLLPPANIPVLLPRDAADQEFPQQLTSADLSRLGIPEADSTATPDSTTRPAKSPATPAAPSTNSLRFITRITGK
jgi:hypothetical protein